MTTTKGGLRAACYLRVSSQKQVGDDRFGLQIQETLVREFAAKNNIRIERTYQDTITGKSITRQGLNELLEHADQYDAVVISSHDRLARRTPAAYAILSALIDAGLTVYASNQGQIDLEDAESALLFGINSLFAHNDHLRITKRMYAGKIAKAKAGKLVRPISAYGYRDNEPYEPEAKWVRYIFSEIRHRGRFAIARHLNELNVPLKRHGAQWYVSTVRSIIENTVYKGQWAFGRKGERVLVPVTPIVTPEEWEAAQQASQSRNRIHTKPGTRLDLFPLQGRIFCSLCGGAMGGHWYKARALYAYYFCRRTLEIVKYGEKCEHRQYYPSHMINDEVRRWLTGVFSDETRLRSSLRMPDVIVEDYTQERERLLAGRERWKRAYGSGVFSLEEVQAELAKVDAALALLPSEPVVRRPEPPNLAAWREAVNSALHGELGLHELARLTHLRVIVSPPGDLELEVLP